MPETIARSAEVRARHSFSFTVSASPAVSATPPSSCSSRRRTQGPARQTFPTASVLSFFLRVLLYLLLLRRQIITKFSFEKKTCIEIYLYIQREGEFSSRWLLLYIYKKKSLRVVNKSSDFGFRGRCRASAPVAERPLTNEVKKKKYKYRKSKTLRNYRLFVCCHDGK